MKRQHSQQNVVSNGHHPFRRLNKPESMEGPDKKCPPSDLRTVKCYLCYSERVEFVCHQCGRLLCRKCQRQVRSWFFIDKAFAHQKPLLTKKLRHTTHCQDCFHKDINPRAISILLVYFALLIVWLPMGWVLSMAFIVGAVVVEIINWIAPRGLEYLFGIPLFCKMAVELQETIDADFNITGSKYLSYEDIGKGTLKTRLSLKPGDRERLENILSNNALENTPITLHSGFIVLERLGNIRKLQRHKANLIALSFQMMKDEFTSLCNNSKEFALEYDPYEIRMQPALQLDPPYNKEFPVHIKAQLVKGGRRLEIKVDITHKLQLAYPKSEDDEKGGEKLQGKPVLDHLELLIPTDWKIEDTDGQFDKTDWQIVWRKKQLNSNTPLSLFIEFQSKKDDSIEDEANDFGVTDDDSSEDEPELLEGNYQITIDDWTISQLHVARDVAAKGRFLVRPPNGLRLTTDDDLSWMIPIVKHKTIIRGNLSLDPLLLSSQEVRAISDDLEEEEVQTVISQERLLVAPDYRVVNEVVEILTKRKVFIRHISETPGYMKEAIAGGSQTRYWEIRGRYYTNSLQPVALHLVIFGEEPRNNQPNCQGTLSFALSLRSYAEKNKDKQNTYEFLKEQHTDFKKLIRVAAYRGRQIDYDGRRTFAWLEEQQVESDFQEKYSSIQKVAAVVTATNNIKQCNIFFVSNGEDRPEQDSTFQGWSVHPESRLPEISTLEQDWIDKWELLTKLRGETNDNR